MSDSTHFDELPALHPHPDIGARASIGPRVSRAMVTRAGTRGVQTSEFWLVALAVAAPVVLAVAGADRRQLRDIAIGAGVAAAGYALGRSYVKGTLASGARRPP